ncbi:hypothetical protein CEXT_1801 [Caerostris extrusa]|uniref:Uncharacterized protein n=1 Tax=Caerostris extrusa TaxID=172846 RepID=A0AAV4S0B8_CAEEX|nr:hypothetical protein CEXT_1801 [Caerostris extrusa]
MCQKGCQLRVNKHSRSRRVIRSGWKIIFFYCGIFRNFSYHLLSARSFCIFNKMKCNWSQHGLHPGEPPARVCQLIIWNSTCVEIVETIHRLLHSTRPRRPASQ